MEFSAHDQLSYSLYLAEQQVQHEENRPDADPKQLEIQQKEVEILRRKLELQPR